MAGKRRATSELNHDNWNVSDDEEEGPGQFVPAETPALQNRTIIKAKRNFSQGSSTSGQGVSPFAKFAGFASNQQNLFSSTTVQKQDTGSPFDKLFKKDTNTNGNSSDATEKQKETETQGKGDTAPSTSKEEQPRNVEYYRQLQSLNESVLNWMQLYYAKNTCSDFTPVFADYKRHLDTLNINYQVKAKNALVGSSTSKTSPEGGDRKSEKTSKEQVFTQGSSNSGDKTEYGAHFSSNTTNTSSVSYGMKLTPTSTCTGSPMGPNSSSKEDNCEKKETPQFSFGFGKSSVADCSFSFATAPPSFAAEKSEEAYEPPKNDFKAVKEEDAVYSKRCKLFFKKDGNFVERGIGTLYLKKLEEKTQLLIRADTNLGNILLNIMLSSSLPMSRTGKNNVLVVSIPNPPVDAKKPDAKEAIPMLIRVKTSEDADELLEKLQAHKS